MKHFSSKNLLLVVLLFISFATSILLISKVFSFKFIIGDDLQAATLTLAFRYNNSRFIPHTIEAGYCFLPKLFSIHPAEFFGIYSAFIVPIAYSFVYISFILPLWLLSGGVIQKKIVFSNYYFLY